jgi:hypothetical protein
MSDALSRLKQQMRQLAQRRLALIRSLLATSSFIRGSLGRRARVCGRPNCRCAQGHLHESVFLSVAVEGRTRQVHVPAGDQVRVAQGVERYSRWRQMLARLKQLDAQEKELIASLSNALLEPYPPDNPIPSAAKRGRRPKEPTDGRG